LKTISSSKRQLIFNQVTKIKKSVIENLRCDNFPRPMIKNAKEDSSRTLTTTDGSSIENSRISTPELSFNNKQTIINQELENWNTTAEEKSSETKITLKNFSSSTECKATTTEMAFDLRDYNETHECIVNDLFMERIAIFRKKMVKCCKKSMLEVFDLLFDQLLTLLTNDCRNYKLYKYDPFADAILLIISDAVHMPINVFLDCLSNKTRLVPSKITEVKKYSCYRKVKSLFDRTLNNAKKLD